ncbi:MAG: alpha-mannosidase [Ruminococcaceae bacterium]|nr:alpha-mannosidase [Oscillospiraceae bacterium]
MGFEKHRMRLVELFDTLIELMENDPSYSYYHMDGQYVVIQDYLEVRPQMKDRLLKLIHNDRIQIGPWYVLQDEYLTSGESNVRNMLYGIKLCREIGAEPVMCGYFPDAFGNISQAPQILNGFGINSAVFGRGVSKIEENNGIVAKGNPSEWIWRSPDGSEVMGVMFSNWYHNAMELPNEKETLKRRLEHIINSTSASAYTPHLLGMNGCDHQPVQTDLSKVIEIANEILSESKVTVKHSNFKDYIEAVKPYKETFPTITGELNGQGTDGMMGLINTASTHIHLKQRNHACQNLLTQQTEPISVLASNAGEEYRHDMILFAWKKLMENHPHDSICCCSSDEVTDEMVSRFEHSRQVGEYVRDEALDYLAKNVHSDAEKSLLVCHTDPGTTTKMITAYLDYPEGKKLSKINLIAPDGSKIPAECKALGRTFTYTLPKDKFRQPKYVDRFEIRFKASISGIGYTLYTVSETEIPTQDQIKIYENGAETDTLKFVVEKNGAITLTDKRSGHVYTDLNIFEDSADAGDSYNYRVLKKDIPITTKNLAAKISVERSSYNDVTFKVINSLDIPVGHKDGARLGDTVRTEICSYLTLTAGIERLDIKTIFENNCNDHRLRALFDPHIETDTVLADGQFDLVERKIYPWEEWINPSNCQRFQSFFTLENGNIGLTVAGRGLHEYEILRNGDNTMALTLLRAIGHMGDWGVFPTPKMQCKGLQTLEYSIIPYSKDTETEAFALAHSFSNDSIVTAEVNAQKGALPSSHTLVSCDSKSLVYSACKQSENGKYTVLRLYNPLSEKIDAELTFDKSVTKLYASNLAEELVEEIEIKEGKAPIKVSPKKIVTYLFKGSLSIVVV